MSEMNYGNGRVYRDKGSPFYYIAYYRNGVEIRRSAKTTDEREARRLLKRKLAEVEVQKRDKLWNGNSSVDLALAREMNQLSAYIVDQYKEMLKQMNELSKRMDKLDTNLSKALDAQVREKDRTK